MTNKAVRKRTMKRSEPESKYLKNTIDFEEKKRKKIAANYKRGKEINLIQKLIKLK